MVVGGTPSSAFYDVELIDLSGQGRTCRKPDNFPSAERGSMGTYFQERALVCGGYPYTSECYYYQHKWDLDPRAINDRAAGWGSCINAWWCMVDHWRCKFKWRPFFNRTNQHWYNRFVPFVDLPEERWLHNIVSIDDNRAMLLGGQISYRETFAYNDDRWEDGPLLSIGRDRCQAGPISL